MHYLQIDQMAQADPSYSVSVGTVCTQAFDTSSYIPHCMNNHGHQAFTIRIQLNFK